MNKKHLGVTVVSLLSLIGLVWFFLFSNDDKVQIVSQHVVTRQDISNTTLVFGKAAPKDVFELSFDVSGKLNKYLIEEGEKIAVGETIAALDSQTVRSQINQANSAVAIERSRYQDLASPVSTQEQDAKKEEIQTQTLVTEGARVDFDNTMSNVLDSYRDLLEEKIDKHYLYPTQAGALLRLKEAKEMSDEDRAILSQKRIDLEKTYIQVNSQGDVAYKYALMGALFESSITLGQNMVSQLQKTSSLSARQVENSIEDFNQDLDDLYDSLNKDYVDWNTSLSRLSLLEKQLVSLQSGADGSALQLQQSIINSKRTNLNSLYADLAQLTLRSPISGIVFDAPLTNFQTISPGQIVASIVPDAPLVIKAQVAESDVQFIGPGNVAEISFDALPELLFTATVSTIKNRENKNATVPTYETVFIFDEGQNFDSVRSGMTANITVSSGKRNNVLYVPTQYIDQKQEGSFVTVKETEDLYTQAPVTTGVKTTSGLTEITSGLVENQVVYIVN